MHYKNKKKLTIWGQDKNLRLGLLFVQEVRIAAWLPQKQFTFAINLYDLVMLRN